MAGVCRACGAGRGGKSAQRIALCHNVLYQPRQTPLGSATLQVPVLTPGSGLPPAGARTPRDAGIPPDEHRSPSPASGMPSPERHQWQVAAQAADRGVDLTARRARQKRLFRSRSDAHGALAAAAAELGRLPPQYQGPEQGSSDGLELESLRVHSRIALLPPDGGMV